MELRQLASFAAVVRCDSFTKAAQQTFLSQPTVSAHVSALEKELQTQLIVRSTKSVEITPRGMELYECALHMLELRENLLRRWAQETGSLLQLGASTIPSGYILPEILPQYSALYPEVSFVVHQGDSLEIIEGLLSGRYDVGMIGMPGGDKALECIPFYRDRMVLITPNTPVFLAKLERGAPAAELLARENVILREHGSGSQRSADAFLESVGLGADALNVTARLNDTEAIKNLVAGGLGVSLISERAARGFVEGGRLLCFELGSPQAERSLYLAFLHESSISASARQFAGFVQDFYRA